jgi:FlaA1/EpsC-like NDP-sugar epimerase
VHRLSNQGLEIVSSATLREPLSPFARAREFCVAVFIHLRAVVTARRFPLIVLIHGTLMVAASYLALWLRFDGAIPQQIVSTYFRVLPELLLIRGMAFMAMGLGGGLWRYAGVWDLSRIFLATVTSSLVLFLFIYAPIGPGGYPRSAVIIDSALLVLLVGGARLFWRVVPRFDLRSKPRRRVLIVGAGDAGEMIVREMTKGTEYQPVGLVDDDRTKMGRTMHGVIVRGTRQDLPRLIRSTGATEVLVAIPSAGPSLIHSLVHQLEPYKVPLTTLPSLTELLNGKVGVKHIRPVSVEDLLPRKRISLSQVGARVLIEGRRVLVTGAGGSIGSELCRQIAAFAPSNLILYERYENSLYTIANDLTDRQAGVPVCPIIGDVTDISRVDAVFAEHHPDVVFHAAAHKHVPLMEANPCEAIKNNVVGTRIVAEAAARHGVERFVLISTDKAANPSSVMGASKRVAELILQGMTEQSNTRFVTVRFGNVLGSNGSVIPRMIEQIRAGGPVTVTHPEIRRYFMLIPEAVSLVLQAAVFARDRETYVLDMGEQLKVLDMARNLIRLTGFVPDEDIPISFIGLRPGEKLTEELIGEGEALERSETDKIFRVRWPESQPEGFADAVAALVRAAGHGRSTEVIDLLRHIVPTFVPAAARQEVAAEPVLWHVATQPVARAVVAAASMPQT